MTAIAVIGTLAAGIVVNAVLVSRQETGATGTRVLHVDAGDVHIVVDGSPTALTMVLIHGTAGSTAWWDEVAPTLATTHHVLRVDLLGHGRSAKPRDGDYSVAAQARLVGEVLDEMGIRRAVVVGHSSGGLVAIAVAEQRRDLVAALALVDTGPSPDAFIPQGPISDLVGTPGVGQLLWRVRTDALVRRSLDTAFTRTDVPDRLVSDALGMTYHVFTAQAREFMNYLAAKDVPARLERIRLPTLVIFGQNDERWRSSSTELYRPVPGVQVKLLPGVGHTPMIEDPAATARLLSDFADQYLAQRSQLAPEVRIQPGSACARSATAAARTPRAPS